VVPFEKEASQTRDCCVAKAATLRAARPDPSLRKSGWLGMTIKLHHYRILFALTFPEAQAKLAVRQRGGVSLSRPSRATESDLANFEVGAIFIKFLP
jgi:hypothetical protein